MKQENLERLKFRNQYILVPHSIDCPFLYNSLNLFGSSVLYTHVDLKVTQYSEGELRLILLGDMFDYEFNKKDNQDILKDIADNDIDQLLKNTERYTGRYVLFYLRNDALYLSHDATATRKIFYCTVKSEFWCASQPYLLAKVIGLKTSTDISKIEYYKSERFLTLSNSNIGDTTIYDEIRQVLPNHYFNVPEYRSVRYWPREQKETISVDECASISAKMIKGYMESIAARYRIMLPVTSGKDSRTLLAATCDIKDEVYYYINKEKRIDEKYKDIDIPKKLFQKLELDFHIVDPYIPVDGDFKRVYYQNNELASEFYLPMIYNYYINFSDRVNLPGNIATGASWFYPIFKKKVNVQSLLKLNKVEQYSHAEKTYSTWLKNSMEFCTLTGFNIMDLFYWEERLGNWGSQIQLDKDIAQNDINPYNSRLLVKTMLSVRPLYSIECASYSLNTKIIKLLWPETLEVPINPSKKNRILRFIESCGLLGFVYRVWYR
ncbi:MAG: hypothetical protein ABFS32_22765 [Bacteroidota bacterium]